MNIYTYQLEDLQFRGFTIWIFCPLWLQSSPVFPIFFVFNVWNMPKSIEKHVLGVGSIHIALVEKVWASTGLNSGMDPAIQERGVCNFRLSDHALWEFYVNLSRVSNAWTWGASLMWVHMPNEVVLEENVFRISVNLFFINECTALPASSWQGSTNWLPGRPGQPEIGSGQPVSRG